jgi:hypothetical protein
MATRGRTAGPPAASFTHASATSAPAECVTTSTGTPP